jgi:DNA repair exonuclease SbcCD nuclease subunit
VRDNLVPQFERVDSSLPQIGVLHSNVGSETGHEPYAPCELDDLVDTGLDYWALGHVHSHEVLRAEKPGIIYPGNTQGLHIGESGPRGCYHVELHDDMSVDTEFVPVDEVRWSATEVDIASLESDEDILLELEEVVRETAAETKGRAGICRVVLSGRGPLHPNLQKSSYAEDVLEHMRECGQGLDPLVWVMDLKDKTRPPVDRDARREAEDVVGGLLRLVDELRESPDEMDSPPECLQPLYEHRDTEEYLHELSEGDLMELLDEAEACCLDWLVKEEEG